MTKCYLRREIYQHVKIPRLRFPNLTTKYSEIYDIPVVGVPDSDSDG